MSLNDSSLVRTEWQRKATTVIGQINDLRTEIEIALRQQPPTETAWRLADADLRCEEARDQLRMAISRIDQIH
jgi:hypothetical protein